MLICELQYIVLLFAIIQGLGGIEDNIIIDISCAKDGSELMAHGICKLLWLNVTKIEFRVTCKEPTEMYYNDKGTMNITYSSTV